MKKTLLTKTLLLLFALIAGSSSSWADEVTYTISAKNTLTTTGTAPTGSSATIAETYNTSKQMTAGNSQTLTLKNYYGYKITNITLSMKSNASKGAGKLSYSTDGGTTLNYIVGSSSAGVNFNDVSWNGEWSTTYVDVSKDVDIIATTSDLVILLEATINSLYCQSYTITYSAVDLNAPSVVVSTTALDFGKVDFGYSKEMTFTVTPSNLKSDLTIASNNAKYTVSPASIAQSTTTATTITVTAAPTAIDDDMDGTITISGGGLSENKTVTLTCTVTDPNANNGTIERPFTVADVNNGTASGSDVYVVGYIVGEFVSKDDPAKTSEFGGTNFALSDSPTELGGANTIPVQLPSGSLRTAWNLNDNQVIGYKVLIKGTLASYFTGKTGVKPPTEITALSIPATIGTSGYITLGAQYDLDPLKATPVGELETYVVTGVSGSAVTLEEIPHIPAGEGVILKGTPGTTYTIPVFQHGYTVSTNLLKVSDGSVTGGDGIYALAEKESVVGFYKVKNTVTIPAGKCYLNTVAGAPDYLSFGGDATGIDEVRGKTEEVRGEFYNLAGQRVAQPTKGLYIVNGKKVVMK